MTNNRKARILIVVAAVLTAAIVLIAPLQASSLLKEQTGTGATPKDAATSIQTPTATPTAAPVAQSGNSNNAPGGTIIGVQAGGARPGLNSLVIIAIDVLTPNGTLPTIVLPPSDDTHPMFNLISCKTVNSPATMEQCLYWKVIGSGETGTAPLFTFVFNSTFRATGVGINYDGTCTEAATPCENPIADEKEGTTVNANAVTESGAVSIPANTIVLGTFGTTNLTDFFGESGTPSGTIIPSLTFENSNAGQNAGLTLHGEIVNPAGLVGPLSGTLPNADTGDNIAQVIGIKTQ